MTETRIYLHKATRHWGIGHLTIISGHISIGDPPASDRSICLHPTGMVVIGENLSKGIPKQQSTECIDL